jgi:hypothetical protein
MLIYHSIDAFLSALKRYMTCHAIYWQKARTKSKDVDGSDHLTGGCVCQRVNLSARWAGWSTRRPGRFTRGKDPVSIVLEAGWDPGPVWTGAENLVTPHRDSIPGPCSPQRVAIPTELSRPSEIPVIVPFCTRVSSHTLAWDWTGACALRGSALALCHGRACVCSESLVTH